MSKEWRSIPFTSNNPNVNMAIDEAIMIARSKNIVPNTLRLYSWKPSAVSIGIFQNVEDEINLDYVNKSSIEVIRRITGGGTVYHDEFGEVTYSIILKENDPIVPTSILESYDVLCQGVINGLKRIGLDCKFIPINDIIVNNKKISGNAQTRRNHVILQHGTILVNVNVEKMFDVLKVSDEKIKDKIISSVQERVTSVNNEINNNISLKEVASVMKDGFNDALKVNFIDGQLTNEEVVLMTELSKNKYSNDKWTFSR